MNFPRFHRPALIGLAVSASFMGGLPVMAQAVSTQQVTQIDKRVGTLESQMRAVQRQVFPGGDKRFFAPEVVAPEQPAAQAPGTPATSALVDLSQRVNSLEQQQRELTGQIEQIRFQMKQATEALQKFRGDAEFRLDTLEGKTPAAPGATSTPASPAAAPVAPPVVEPAAPRPPAPAPATNADGKPVDALAAQYEAGYALYVKKDYIGAEKALVTFANANGTHPRSSNAWYWAGRARMQQGLHAEAARAFTEGYRRLPKGERAHNSLLYLSRALLELKQPKAACQALDELETRFPDRMTTAFSPEVAATRAQAKC